ncbi:MAG: hypothetical protein V3S14_06845 [Anaerolineae bacterium]
MINRHLYPDLAVKAAYSALRKLECNSIPDDDLEDMLQCAQVAIWQCQGKPENYQYIAAYYAALRHFFRFYLHWKGGTKGSFRPTPWSNRVDLPENDKGEIMVEHPAQTHSLPLPQEIVDQLAHICAQAYRTYGTSRHHIAASAGRRDAQILNLIVQGYTPSGIAQETGMALGSVRRTRARMREVLRQYEKGDVQ